RLSELKDLKDASVSWQVPCARGFTELFERRHIGRQRLTVGELIGAVTSFGIEKIKQTGGSVLVRVFGNVAGLRGLVQISRAEKTDDFVVGVNAFPRIRDVRSHLFGCFAVEFVGLCN